MIKTVTACALFCFIYSFAQAQMKIGAATAPSSTSVLELESTTKGFVPTRVSLTALASPLPLAATPLDATIVYNTNNGVGNGIGLYIWYTSKWNYLATASLLSNNWNILGNAGTTSALNFLGTTDNNGLAFRTNNVRRMLIDSLGDVAIGSTAYDPYNREKLLVDYGNTTSNTLANFRGSTPGYLQLNVQNTNSGSNSSSDIVATADNGTDSTYYIDFGINSSTYAPSVDNWGGKNDAYLYSNSRNLVMGTQALNSDIIFLAGGGQLKQNTVLRIAGATGNVVVGKGEATNGPIGNIIRGPNALSTLTNITGGDLTLQGGASTGTSTGGNVFLNGGSSVSGTNGSVGINTSGNGVTNIGSGSSTGNISVGNAANSILFPGINIPGAIIYTTNSAGKIGSTAAGTAGQVLTSNGAGAPTWTTAAGGTVTSVSANAPLSVATGTTTPVISLIGTPGSVLYGTGTASAFNTAGPANTVLHGSATMPVFSQVNLNAGGDVTGVLPIANGGTALSTVPTNGQILIGNGTGYTLGNITAGAGIIVTNTAGAVTIATSVLPANNWQTTGNSGTNSGANFLGTTDNASLRFKVNNTSGGFIDSSAISGNTFFGNSAGLVNTGAKNTAMGALALRSNTTGASNVAIGVNALNSNVGGTNITAIGTSAMQYANNTAGTLYSLNTAVGYAALQGSTSPAANTGLGNTAIGYQALQQNSSGSYNIGIGVNTLAGNSSGSNNTAMGYYAGGATSSNGGNVYIGYKAGVNATGANNTAIGSQALNGASTGVTGSNNAFFGSNAGVALTSGSNNIGLGYNTFFDNSSIGLTSGNNNIALGSGSNPKLTTGSDNIAIGAGASPANVTTGSGNLTIGSSVDVPTAGGSNQMNIKNVLFGTGLNGTLAAPAGNIGIGTNAPTAQLHTTGSVRFAGLGSSTGNTNVLTTDASGNVTTTAVSSVLGGATTNTLTNAVNTISSTVNGVNATAPAVNTVTNTVSGNTISTIVNGVPGTAVTMPNIYTSDGTLAGNRTVTQGTNTLAFTSAAVNGFSVDGSTFSVDAANNRIGIGTQTPAALLDVKGTMHFTGSSSGYVGFVSPASAGTTTYTLPATDGTNGYALTTNGSGTLSWVSPTASTTNVLSSSVNTLTSTVNGVTDTALAVTSNATSLTGSNLVTTVNGVASAPLNLSSLVSNAWNILGNTGTTSALNFLGTNDNNGLAFRTNSVRRMLIDSLGDVAIGSTAYDPINREKLLVDYGNTSSNTIANFRGNTAGYLQINVQNTNSGPNSSTDVVATADNGTDSTFYVDLGINSSTYAPTVDNWGNKNDAYLYSYSRNLVMGTQQASSDVMFLLGGGQIKQNTVLRMSGLTGNIIVGRGEATNAPVGNIIRAPNVLSTIANTAGGDLTLQGGASTGTAIGGNVFINGGISSGTGVGGVFAVNTSSAERMRVDASGNVGIGTSLPSNKLTIYAASNPLYMTGVQATSSFSTDSILTISNGLVKKAPYSSLPSGGSSAGWLLTGNSITSGNFLGTTNNLPLILKANNTQNAYLDGNGNAIFSQTSPGSLSGTYNLGIGYQVMNGSNSGSNNIAVGQNTMSVNSGNYNYAMGYKTMSSNTGSYNVAVGDGSLNANAGGGYNLAMGYQAMNGTSSGTDNVAFGQNALNTNSGNYNFAMGLQALANNSGSNNFALQPYAMNGTNSGSYNVGIGSYSLNTNSGNNNFAVGYQSMYSNSNGNYNVAFGQGSLANNSGGSNNFAAGYQAMGGTNTGNYNVAFGQGTLNSNSGGNNFALGSYAMNSSNSGSYNMALGQYSLNSNSGSNNVALGSYAMNGTNSGAFNLAFGQNALNTNSGAYNFAFGYQALYTNAGIYNIGFDQWALKNNTSGNYNFGVGYNSLSLNTTGSYNLGLGYTALATNTTGNNNIAIGYSADVSSGSLTNATAIGENAKVGINNSTAIGYNAAVSSSSASSNAVVIGSTNANVGIGTSTPNTNANLDVNGTFKMGANGTVTKNIVNASASVNGSVPPEYNAVTIGILSVLTLATGTNYYDATITLPTTLTSTQGSVHVSPSFDLPGGVLIAFARITSTNQIKVRFLNTSNTAQTISGNLYITVTEF